MALVFKVVPLNAVAIGTEAAIWTPATGFKWQLIGALLSVGTAAGNVLLKDGTGGTTVLILPKAPADTPFRLDFSTLKGGLVSTGAGADNKLTATGAATATISGYLYGYEWN